MSTQINKTGKPLHVDDFIGYFMDDNISNNYARFFLYQARMAAVFQSMWMPFIQQFRLFCTYNGKRYRVTGASRMGDIWLREDHNTSHGYDEGMRVMVEECSEWSNYAEEKSYLADCDKD